MTDSDLDNVDTWRGPTASQGVLVGAVGVSGGGADEDQRAADAAVRAFG